MKKTLVALAALAATASFAQVTLSGRAVMDYSAWSATGATAGATSDYTSRQRVADAGSRITFAVNEDLGGGLRAGVYCETGLNLDQANAVGQDNAANANISEWCSREGRVALGNDDFEFRLGRQNVYWTQGELNETGSLYLVGTEQLTNLRNGGPGVYGVRLDNTAMVVLGKNFGNWANSSVYTSQMSGTGSLGENVAANTSAKGKVQGFKIQYNLPQFLFMIDYQSSTNSAAAAGAASTVGTNSFDRTAINYGAGYRYNPTSIVSVQYWNKKRVDVTTAGAAFISPWLATAAANQVTAGDAKNTGWGINVKHDLGSGYMFHAQYAKANNLQTPAGEVASSGASAYTLGLTKHLSKRTHLVGAVAAITNQDAAGYNMDGASYRGAKFIAQGSDPKAYSLGVVHQF